MNAKLLFKIVLLIVMLLMLVLIGVYNKETVTLSLPALLPKSIRQPAAIMYFGFFAAGLLTGAVLTAGGGSKDGGGSAKSSRSGK
jgi:uncharacterized integral membrane protein